MLVPQPFGSVIFLLGGSGNGAEQSYLDRRVKWLSEWLTWFLQRNGILSGRNLHLLYDRGVSVLGPGALAQRREISRLAAVAGQHGATFASELYLTDCLKGPDGYDELLQAGRLKSIIFNPEGCVVNGKEDTVLAIVEAAISHGTAVILLGLPSFWDAVGALHSQIVNSCNFRIVPSEGLWEPEASAAAEPEGSDRNSDAKLPATGAATAWAFSPCDTKFAVYVTPDGELYPCLGLIGCQQWCMGTIDHHPEESRFATDVKLDVLARWGGQGPDLGATPPLADNLSHLPRVCAVHRQLVIGNSHEK